MDSSLLIGLEMAGVLGLALVWGGYELWTLRRYREREARERERQAAQRESGETDGASTAQDTSSATDTTHR